MSDLEIARDDIALSAIAGGNAPDSDDPTLLLLRSFRADLDAAVAVPEHVESERVVVPLRAKRRSASLIALSAAAGIVVGGITAGAIAFADKPGDVLYTAHAAVFGETRTRTSDVHALLDQAAGLLARGDRAGARRLIGRAVPLIDTAPEADRAALRRRVDDLTALAAEPVVRPTPSPSRPTPRPSPSESDDHGGSSGSGKTPKPSVEPSDDSGGGSGSSGSGSSGSGSGDVTKTIEPGDDHGGSGHD